MTVQYKFDCMYLWCTLSNFKVKSSFFSTQGAVVLIVWYDSNINILGRGRPFNFYGRLCFFPEARIVFSYETKPRFIFTWKICNFTKKSCRVDLHTKILHLSRSGKDILFCKSEMDARLVVVYRSSETSTNQSDVIIRSNDRFWFYSV